MRTFQRDKRKTNGDREREREREREIQCILKAQVPGVSVRPPPCSDADDLLSCSATVGNLGDGRARHLYLGKALRSFACAKDRSKHTGPPF